MLTVFPRWVVSGPTPAQQQMVVAETCLGQVHNAGPVCQVHILYLHIYIYTTLMYLYFDMCRCWTSPAPWTRTTTPRSAGRSTRCISRSRENIQCISPICHVPFRLLVLDVDGTQKVDKFSVPSACICHKVPSNLHVQNTFLRKS